MSEISEEDKIDRFLKVLTDGIDNARRVIDDFRQDLGGDNPAYVLCFASRIFEEAARLEIFKEVVDILTYPKSKATLQDIKAHATERALHAARFPKDDCSPETMIKQYKGQAWAEILELFDWRKPW